MKKDMIKLAAIATLFSFSTVNASAQVQRSEWTAGPIITTANPLYSTAGLAVEFGIGALAYGVDEDGNLKGDFPTSSAYWMPIFDYKYQVNSMKINDEKAKFRNKTDWSLNNYSVGYRLGYMSRTIPLGFEIQANYEQKYFAFKMPNDQNYREATRTMFVPTALLKVRFGNYYDNKVCPMLELGGSYDYTLSYKEKTSEETIKKKDLVNNGFSGIIGLGYNIPTIHLYWSLQYKHQFYKHYNKDAEYNGEKLNINEKSTFGTIMVSAIYAF